MLDLMQSNSKKAVPKARQILYEFKNKAANEVGIEPLRYSHYDYPSMRAYGNIGGYMVKKLKEVAESELIGKM